jgi:hypothetical protein
MLIESFGEFAAPVEITLFAKSGGPLTKCIALAADGSVTTDSSECRMSRGSARRVRIADVAQLGKLIEGLASTEAIALGALRPSLPDPVQIVTKHELNGVAQHGVIARTGHSIVFSNGQTAFALLDFDTKGMPPDVAARLNTVSDGKALDTIAACPPLTILETANLRELHARETNRLVSESARARAVFIAQQTERLVERTGMGAQIAADVIARWCNGVLLPDVVLPFDDQDFKGMTVGDVLADPLRFEGATLADPLEGVGYGRCKAKIMLRSDGAPWIHSFAHGRTAYELRLDARAIRVGVEKARDEAAVDTFVGLALAADLDDVELEQLVDYTAKSTGIGFRAILRKFKAAQQQKAKQRAREKEESSLAERRDPRPQIDRPLPDAEWLPQMRVLNDVLGASSVPLPPMRDIEGVVTKVHKRPVPGMHAFSNRDANLE